MVCQPESPLLHFYNEKNDRLTGFLQLSDGLVQVLLNDVVPVLSNGKHACFRAHVAQIYNTVVAMLCVR